VNILTNTTNVKPNDKTEKTSETTKIIKYNWILSKEQKERILKKNPDKLNFYKFFDAWNDKVQVKSDGLKRNLENMVSFLNMNSNRNSRSGVVYNTIV